MQKDMYPSTVFDWALSCGTGHEIGEMEDKDALGGGVLSMSADVIISDCLVNTQIEAPNSSMATIIRRRIAYLSGYTA